MILGTNRDEQKPFLLGDSRFAWRLFGVIPRIKDEEGFERFAAYFSDQWKALAVDEPAMLISEAQGGPVYAYRFDWDEGPSSLLADFSKLLGAGHGLEISYVFGDFDNGISLPFLLSEENEAGRMALSDTMMNYWAEFAYTSSPGTGRDGQQPAWTPWQNGGDKVILLDTPADGGAQMSDVLLTAANLKQRIAADAKLDQAQRCELYAQLFLLSYQSTDFWHDDEYATLGGGGCKQFDPYSFAH